MAANPWLEDEIKAAIKAYFQMLRRQEEGLAVRKTDIYRKLAEAYPARSAKAFELKFQNISAILYEERLPFADGLLPRFNYQRLLKLMVLDYLDRTRKARQTPLEILTQKLRQLNKRGFLPITGRGTGRYGLALEKHLGIPPNCDKGPDFMGIELKTKSDKSLHTLFSRVPSRFTGCGDKRELVAKHGYDDSQRGRRALYTSFNCKGDSLGFSLAVKKNTVVVVRNGSELLEYDKEALEEALLSKHTETAFVAATKRNSAGGEAQCRFDKMIYCRWPSILKFVKLIDAGHVFLDFTLSVKGGRVKDHGFLWRVKQDTLEMLYLKSESFSLKD